MKDSNNSTKYNEGGVSPCHLCSRSAKDARRRSPCQLCSGSGQDVGYYFSFCSSNTEATEVQAFCEASGRDHFTFVATSSCPEWANPDVFDIEERLAQKYCHECSVGTAVCSSSNDQVEVCAQVAAKPECTAGLTYEDDRASCSSETDDVASVVAACRANGTYVNRAECSETCSD